MSAHYTTSLYFFFFFNDTATTEIYTLSLHDALPISDSYAVAPDATEIDVTPAVREELMLAAPRYVLCRDDCKGLCPRCGKDLNAGSCECAPATEARWQPLKALKDKLSS